MNKVLKNNKYMVRDTDSGLSYEIFRSSPTINDDFKTNVPEHITEDMGIYISPDKEFYYVRWDENDKKYYARFLDIYWDDYIDTISQTIQDWSFIKEALGDNQNPEYEAIPDEDETVEPMELEREISPNEEKKTKPIEEKRKYSEVEVEKYNKFVQEFNLMMSEKYSREFKDKKYKELVNILKDKKLLEMLQDESFSRDEGKNILSTMQRIYNRWQER